MWLKNKHGGWFEKPDEEIDVNKVMNKKIRNQILDKRDNIKTINLIENGKDKTVEKIINDKNNRVIGTVGYLVENGEYSIYRIDVDENYRRKGIATKLMKSVQREAGDKYINLGTLTEDGKKLMNSIAILEESTVLLGAKIYKGIIK